MTFRSSVTGGDMPTVEVAHKTFLEEHFMTPSMTKLASLLNKSPTLEEMIDFDPTRSVVRIRIPTYGSSLVCTLEKDNTFTACYVWMGVPTYCNKSSMSHLINDVHLDEPLTLDSITIDEVSLEFHQKHCWRRLVQEAVCQKVPTIHHAYINLKTLHLEIMYTGDERPELPAYLQDIIYDASPVCIRAATYHQVTVSWD